MEQSPVEKLTVIQLEKKASIFYGTWRFITATGPYTEPDQSSPHPPNLLIYDKF
jgi:hypothetical protein